MCVCVCVCTRAHASPSIMCENQEEGASLRDISHVKETCVCVCGLYYMTLYLCMIITLSSLSFNINNGVGKEGYAKPTVWFQGKMAKLIIMTRPVAINPTLLHYNYIHTPTRIILAYLSFLLEPISI